MFKYVRVGPVQDALNGTLAAGIPVTLISDVDHSFQRLMSLQARGATVHPYGVGGTGNALRGAFCQHATSANIAGSPTAGALAQPAPELVRPVACAIGRGPLDAGGASTIVDLVAWERSGDIVGVRVLRDEASRGRAALELLGSIG